MDKQRTLRSMKANPSNMEPRKHAFITRKMEEWVTIGPKWKKKVCQVATASPDQVDRTTRQSTSRAKDSAAPPPPPCPVPEENRRHGIIPSPTQAKHLQTYASRNQSAPRTPLLSCASAASKLPNTKNVRRRKGVTFSLTERQTRSSCNDGKRKKPISPSTRKPIARNEVALIPAGKVDRPTTIKSLVPTGGKEGVNGTGLCPLPDSGAPGQAHIATVTTDEQRQCMPPSSHGPAALPKQKSSNRVTSRKTCPKCQHVVQRLDNHLRRTCMPNAKTYTPAERETVLLLERQGSLPSSSSRQKQCKTCPKCHHLVKSLPDHLRRTCMKNAKEEDRQKVIMAENQRLGVLRNSLIRESLLLSTAVIGDDGRAYWDVNQVMDLLERCGILVHRDMQDIIGPVPPMPNLLPSAVASPPVDVQAQNMARARQNPSSFVVQAEVDASTSTVRTPSPLPGPSTLDAEVEVHADTCSTLLPGPSQMVEAEVPAHMFGTGSKRKLVLSPSADDSSGDSPFSSIDHQDAECTASIVKRKRLDSSSCHSVLVTPRKPVLAGEPDEHLTFFSNIGAKGICNKRSGNTIRRYQRSVNISMSKAGFYNKFDLKDCPVLTLFEEYLEKTLHISLRAGRCQTVANVNRVLYQLDPSGENPDAVADPDAIRNYFGKLPTELSVASQQNYLQSLKMFLNFCEQSTLVRDKYPKLITNISAVTLAAASITSGLSRVASQRMAHKRAAQFRGEEQPRVTIDEILHVVESMKQSALRYLRIVESSTFHPREFICVHAYFAAVITLKNAQRPSVFINMTLQEFYKPVRTTMPTGEVRVTVCVADHKTATNYLAYVSFTEEEYGLIQKYVQHIRPKIAKGNSPKTVFLNSGGTQVFHISTDVQKVQKRLGLKTINATEARRAVQTASSNILTSDQQESVANYLAHSKSTAHRYYVHVTKVQIQKSAEAMSLILDPSTSLAREPAPVPRPDE